MVAEISDVSPLDSRATAVSLSGCVNAAKNDATSSNADIDSVDLLALV